MVNESASVLEEEAAGRTIRQATTGTCSATYEFPEKRNLLNIEDAQSSQVLEPVFSCGRCGNRIVRHDRYCDVCGLPTTQQSQIVEDAQSSEVLKEPMFSCGRCGNRIVRHDRYCDVCGLPTTQQSQMEIAHCRQRISGKGRILVSKKAWIFRGITLAGMAVFMIYTVGLALSVGDPLIVYSTLMPVHAVGLLTIGWIFFRNKATGRVPDDLVSVIIPVYNQEDLMEKVVNAVFRSTYTRLEVIAVNDGSGDKTAEVLDRLARKNPQLKVIHKPNGGKRSAVAAGFHAARGNFMVLMDSDSIVDKRAIEELMKVFSGNPKVGGLVAHGKVLNSTENLLTKCQDVWYDFCFNINKSTESTFGAVLCLSGCMAAYRREAIAEFMTFWAQDKFRFGDDRHLTAYVMATPWAKSELAPLQRRLLKSMANYDDAEDRGLTSQTVAKDWETVYVPTAVVYTDVPRTLRNYIRQQTRWRKGYLRSTFFMSAFFWRKHPILAFLFYMDFMSALITPAVIFSIFIYGPIFLHSYLFPFTYVGGQLLIGLVIGLDYRFRDPTAKQWMYKPVMNLISCLLLPWLLFPAIWGFKRNGWLTR